MLAQKLILSYSSKMFAQLIQIAASIVVARIAGPGVIGTIAFGLAYVSMFKFIAELGVGSAHIKLLSEGRDEAKCIGTYARMKIFLTTIFFIIVIGVFSIQKFILNITFESPVHEKVILLTLIIVTINELCLIPSVTFAGKTEQAKQEAPLFIRTLLCQILRIIVVMLGYGALTLAFSNLLSAILVLPIYLLLFKGYPIGKYDKDLAKQYIAISLPIVVILIAQTIIYWSDKIIIQYTANSAEVGYYVAGFKFGNLIFLIGLSVGMLFFPVFSKAIAEKQYDKINSNLRKLERFTLIFILPVILFASIYSDLIVLPLLGHKFINSIPILSIINISMFIMVLSMPYGNVISAKGLFKLSARLHIAQLLFFVIMAFLFVSPFMLNLKGMGMAFTILLSNVFIASLFIVFSKKNLKQLRILPGKHLLVFGVIYSFLCFLCYNYLPSFTMKLIFIFIYFAGYWGLLMLLGLVIKEDWEMLGNLVNLTKMKKYINSEIKLKK